MATNFSKTILRSLLSRFMLNYFRVPLVTRAARVISYLLIFFISGHARTGVAGYGSQRLIGGISWHPMIDIWTPGWLWSQSRSAIGVSIKDVHTPIVSCLVGLIHRLEPIIYWVAIFADETRGDLRLLHFAWTLEIPSRLYSSPPTRKQLLLPVCAQACRYQCLLFWKKYSTLMFSCRIAYLVFIVYFHDWAPPNPSHNRILWRY
jgi:hypothetical protein